MPLYSIEKSYNFSWIELYFNERQTCSLLFWEEFIKNMSLEEGGAVGKILENKSDLKYAIFFVENDLREPGNIS